MAGFYLFAQGREALHCSLQRVKRAFYLSHMPQATSQYTLLITFLPVWMTTFLLHPLLPQISPFKHHTTTSSYRAPASYIQAYSLPFNHIFNHMRLDLWSLFKIFSLRNDAVLLKWLLALQQYFNKTFYSTSCACKMCCARTSVGRMDA